MSPDGDAIERTRNINVVRRPLALIKFINADRSQRYTGCLPRTRCVSRLSARGDQTIAASLPHFSLVQSMLLHHTCQSIIDS